MCLRPIWTEMVTSPSLEIFSKNEWTEQVTKRAKETEEIKVE